MLEIRGREIRTTEVIDSEGVILRSGQQLFIGCDNAILPSDGTRLQVNFRDLPKIVKPNDIIYIDDGQIVCLVTDCEQVSVYLFFNKYYDRMEYM
jgi:pyruvate kinase